MEKIKVMIATPAFSGQVHICYALSLAETINCLCHFGIEPQPRISHSGSLLVAERNRLIKLFLESECTHILFVDSDLGWPAIAVKSMIEHDRDFVAGLYPARGSDIFLFRPCLNKDETLVMDERGLFKMNYVPAGFMLLKRKALEKMIDHFPELYFKSKQDGIDGNCLFDTEVWEGEFWGEDYVFCRRAREAGIDIWVDPLIEFEHHGIRGRLIDSLKKKEDAIVSSKE